MNNKKILYGGVLLFMGLVLSGASEVYSLSKQATHKSFIKQAFSDVIENMNANEKIYQQYFSKNYMQYVDGKVLDFNAFVEHMKQQKKAVKSISVDFQYMVCEENKVFTIHVVDVVKKNGNHVKIKVIAMFIIENGKIAKCDELTILVKGDASDKNLASCH